MTVSNLHFSLIYLNIILIYNSLPEVISTSFSCRDKPPSKLRNAKLVYNAIMSVFSFYVFYGVCRYVIEIISL